MELILVGVVIILFSCMVILFKSNKKKNCSIKTSAKIVEVKQEQYFKKINNETSVLRLYRPIYEFDFRNKNITVADSKAYRSKTWLKRINTFIKLYYNKNNPHQIYVSHVNFNIVISITTCIGIIIVAIGILRILNVI